MSDREDTRRTRRSDRLAALLEDAGAVATANEEDRVLAQLADALQAVPTDVPPMRQEFREDLRASVLQAARDQRHDPALLTRLRDRARRLRYSTAAVAGAGTAAMALSGGGVALAAEHAQPDDLLYDVKLALEDLRLTLTVDPVARGERAMSYALDRVEEARLAATAGDDEAAATALRGAADRTAEGSRLLLATGLVDPVVSLAGDLSTVVTAVEAMRPTLGALGNEAADALLEIIVDATEQVLDVIDASQWPGGEVPVLPDLAVPQQTPEPTATPVPDVTTPPVEGATEAAPSGASTETPVVPGDLLPGDLLPGDQLPGGPLPVVPLPDPPRPELPVDGENPLPAITEPVQDALDGVSDTVEGLGDTVDGVGDAVEDTLDDVIDVVPSPVQSALPDPVEDVFDDLPGTVDDVLDVVPGLLDPLSGLL